MAKQHFEDAFKEDEVAIEDKFLVVETNHDGYTNTHLGQYAFRVLLEDEEYKVFPIYLRDDGVYVNEKYPIIQTDGELVFFSTNTTIDPYGATHVEEIPVLEEMSKEKAVLHAFEAYVKDAFRLAVYHIMLVEDEDRYIDDVDEDFERIHAFERDVIHPRAGGRN